MIRYPEQHRIRSGAMASATGDDGGAFRLTLPTGEKCNVVASSGFGWEHVSVSMPHRCPTWAEMCFVKKLFWEPEDCVVQYHPPQSNYVNVHPYCLHLWRALDSQMPTPPHWMVGPLKREATCQ